MFWTYYYFDTVDLVSTKFHFYLQLNFIFILHLQLNFIFSVEVLFLRNFLAFWHNMHHSIENCINIYPAAIETLHFSVNN